MKEIRKIARYNALIESLIGAILLLGGVLLILLGQQDFPMETVLLFRGLGFIIGLPGLFFLTSGILSFFKGKNDLTLILEKSPKDVVWYYSYVVITKPFGVNVYESATIFFYLKDGEKYTLSVKRKRLDHIMRLLNNHLSQASVGYSVEKEQLFRANPMLLYRD